MLIIIVHYLQYSVILKSQTSIFKCLEFIKKKKKNKQTNKQTKTKIKQSSNIPRGKTSKSKTYKW